MKPENVTIINICADQLVIFGLGSDSLMYRWNSSTAEWNLMKRS